MLITYSTYLLTFYILCNNLTTNILQVLEKQLAAIRLQQENAKTLKEEEARLMEEEKKQREAEERHLLQVNFVFLPGFFRLT